MCALVRLDPFQSRGPGLGGLQPLSFHSERNPDSPVNTVPYPDTVTNEQLCQDTPVAEASRQTASPCILKRNLTCRLPVRRR